MSAPDPGAEPHPRRGAAPAQPGLAARRVAAALLDGVIDQGRALDDLLGESAALAALTRRDRAFARLLVATTLRRLGQIDAVLAGLVDRPLPGRAAAARTILRLGAAQLLFLGTPAYAAVGNAVAQAGATAAARPYKGLVNAVLRRLSGQDPAGLARPDPDAARRNTPGWLWRSWERTYGDQTTRAIAAIHLAEPPLDLSLKPDADAADWARRLEAEVLPTGTLRRAGGGRIAELPGFAEGAWWVQDAAAALPARLIPAPRGRLVFDLCAAPGGKTAQLAAAGARVVAVDRSAARLGRLRENLARLALPADCVAADATGWQPGRRADAVLLDAPCSSTGTLRRHPDVAWRKQAEDIASLVALQDRLLDAAARLLEPGGTLVYCTCSLQPEEGPERIAALLARNPALRRVPVTAAEVAGQAQFLTPDGDLRTLPSHFADRGGLDGFFAARLASA